MKIYIVSDGTPMGTHVMGKEGVPIENVVKVDIGIYHDKVFAILIIEKPTVNMNNVDAELQS